MTKVMQGVRVLEVAQFTFVPVAGAVLADWGADVIKIEHPVRGDTQRGFINIESAPVNPERNVMTAHPNRGKRSVGIDISTPEGQQLIYELAKQCDVFLTNYLPSQRAKLKIEVEDIRAANPNIIYARGSALGDKGPDRLKGGFDATAFWARAGSSMCVTPPELGGPLTQPGPAYGDTIGGTNLALGISAALFHRERTGEAVELDVSLLGSGVWTVGCGLAMGMELGRQPFVPKMPQSGGWRGNPLVGVFETSDGRFINLTVLTPGRYLEDTWNHLGLPELMEDPRFNTAEAVMENWAEGSDIVTRAIAAHPFAYWIQRFQTFTGQWAPYQGLMDVAQDPQVLANDMIIEIESNNGGKPIKLAAAPVQFNHQPIVAGRYPEASEHTELVLTEMGIDWDRIEELKTCGVIA